MLYLFQYNHLALLLLNLFLILMLYKWNCFLVSFLGCSLQAHRNKVDFWMLIFCLVNLINSLIQLGFFGRLIRIFLYIGSCFLGTRTVLLLPFQSVYLKFSFLATLHWLEPPERCSLKVVFIHTDPGKGPEGQKKEAGHSNLIISRVY